MQDKSDHDALVKRIQALEQALAESKETRDRALAVLDNLPVMVCNFLPGGKITYVNQAYAAYFGTTTEQLRGTRFLELIPEAKRETTMASITALTQASPVMTHEHPVRVPSGEIRWQRWTNQAIFDDQGRLSEYRSLGRDITETIRSRDELKASEQRHRELSETLREREAHLRTLLETIPDLVWLKDPDGVYISCNLKFERFFGAGESEIKGKTDHDFVEKELADFFREKDMAALRANRSLVNEEEVVFADDGHRELLETIKTPMYDAEGRLIGILGVGRDITARKKAETRAIQSRDRLESILTNIRGFTYRCRMDKDWTMLYMSPQVAQITGYPTTDFINNQVRSYESIIYRDDTQWVRDNVQKAIATGKPWEFEYRIRHRDGSICWVYEKGAASLAQDGSVACLDGFTMDVNERKLLEEHLSQSHKMEAIGTLAGGIAHDFNNILASILGYSELLREDVQMGEPVQEIDKKIQHIIQGGIRARELVAQILAFSRAGRGTLEPVRVTAIAKEASKLLKATLPNTIRIERDFSSDSRVLADATKIHQVFMNLCTNAAYAMGHSKGVLSIGVQDVFLDPTGLPEGNHRIAPGRFLRLTVADTGCGMDPDTCRKIMEPFFTTKPSGEGSGMGLWVVRGIVKNLGGFIDVESRPGEGTRFEVYMPACSAGPVTESGIGRVAMPGGDERILFVDDEISLTQLANAILSGLGYGVTAFNSAVQALDHFKTDPGAYDLVMTDMLMPEMAGDVLSREIRKLNPDIPLVLCTGGMDPLVDNGDRNIFDAVLRKPILTNDLAGTIRDVLDGKQP